MTENLPCSIRAGGRLAGGMKSRPTLYLALAASLSGCATLPPAPPRQVAIHARRPLPHVPLHHRRRHGDTPNPRSGRVQLNRPLLHELVWQAIPWTPLHPADVRLAFPGAEAPAAGTAVTAESGESVPTIVVHPAREGIRTAAGAVPAAP